MYCAIPNEEEHSTKPSTPSKFGFRKIRKVCKLRQQNPDCDDNPYIHTYIDIIWITFQLIAFQCPFVHTYVCTYVHSVPITVISPLSACCQDHSDSPSSNGAAHSSSGHSGYTTRFQSTLPTHRFAIAGHTMLSLKDIASPTGSFPLKKGAVGSSGTAATGGGDAGPLLPLWGQFSCRLMAQPECATSSRASGFINVQVRGVWCAGEGCGGGVRAGVCCLDEGCGAQVRGVVCRCGGGVQVWSVKSS